MTTKSQRAEIEARHARAEADAHHDRGVLLAENSDASKELAELGIADDGSTLVDRIRVLAAETPWLRRLWPDEVPITGVLADRIRALVARRAALPSKSRGHWTAWIEGELEQMLGRSLFSNTAPADAGTVPQLWYVECVRREKGKPKARVHRSYVLETTAEEAIETAKEFDDDSSGEWSAKLEEGGVAILRTLVR